MKSLRGAHFLHLAFQGGGAHPWPPVSYAAAHSRKVQPPNHGLKQSQTFQDGIIS